MVLCTGREEQFLDAMLDADLEAKTGLAVASWGYRGGITTRLDDSHRLDAFVEAVSNTFQEQVIEGTNTSSVPFVEHKMFDLLDYYKSLGKYKFLIAPRGGGLQSPKFAEAIMMMTVPVTKRYPCFEQLQKFGFPILLVNEWEDITEELLAQVRDCLDAGPLTGKGGQWTIGKYIVC